MTILDLMRLIQRYIKLVVALPVIFALVALVWSLFVQASYTATASYIISGDLAFAQGLASKEAAFVCKIRRTDFVFISKHNKAGNS